jgi:hypothetical protein
MLEYTVPHNVLYEAPKCSGVTAVGGRYLAAFILAVFRLVDWLAFPAALPHNNSVMRQVPYLLLLMAACCLPVGAQANANPAKEPSWQVGGGVAESKTISAPDPEAPVAMVSQQNTATANEDRTTQRKLTLFTGVLAGVGLLQLVVMFLTWLVYRRQAHEMMRQRHEMRRQRRISFLQWRAMRAQLREAAKQSGILEKSVSAAQSSADAARISADVVARVSVPTLKIEQFKIGNVGAAGNPAFFQYPKFEITIKNYGQTPAFLRFWTIKFTCDELPATPVYAGKGFGIPLEKQVIPGGGSFTLQGLSYLDRDCLSIEDAQAVAEQVKPFAVYGFICYGDIFGNPLQRFKFCETLLNVFGELHFQWTELFSPAAYIGADPYPTKQQEEAEQTN